jgi:hypothetical protein
MRIHETSIASDLLDKVKKRIAGDESVFSSTSSSGDS